MRWHGPIFLRSNPGVMPGGGHSMMANQPQVVHTPARASGEAGGGTGDTWISGCDNPSFSGDRPVPPGMGPAGLAPAPGSAASTPPPRLRAPPPGVAGSRNFARAKFVEKPIGEWNIYDISVRADKLTYRLNGDPINEGCGAVAMSGKIGLECENTPIVFRNIRLATTD